jgi:hypothetical protein
VLTGGKDATIALRPAPQVIGVDNQPDHAGIVP